MAKKKAAKKDSKVQVIATGFTDQEASKVIEPLLDSLIDLVSHDYTALVTTHNAAIEFIYGPILVGLDLPHSDQFDSSADYVAIVTQYNNPSRSPSDKPSLNLLPAALMKKNSDHRKLKKAATKKTAKKKAAPKKAAKKKKR